MICGYVKDADGRWVDILASETGWSVYKMWENGWEMPSAAPAFPDDTDRQIVMLGSNNLLQGCSQTQVTEKLKLLFLWIKVRFY